MKRSWIVVLLIAASLGTVAWQSFQKLKGNGPGENYVKGNGRVEAAEIDIAAKIPGRVGELYVKEGDYVRAGQPLLVMDMLSLQAQRDEALARLSQTRQAVATANAVVAVRQSDLAAARALEVMRQTELDSAQRRLTRTKTLSKEGAASIQELDDDQARVKAAQASLNAAQAQARAAEAAVVAAQAEVSSAESMVQAAQASVKRIETEIADGHIAAPRDARVQFIVARPAEVVSAGAPILNLVDLNDAHMTFFLPETEAGRVKMGAPVRIVLDAFPDDPVPATVSYVSSTAQFTPKTVETANERQKMMFRVKAKIDQDYIQRNMQTLKTGLPGVAWVSLDGTDNWPDNLKIKK